MAAFAIDTTSYSKAGRYPQRHGYQVRGTVPTSIVVHSTEGKPGQTFDNAAQYLYTSADVSAHFLVGRDGAIVQFLDPKTYQAWHAGNAQAAYGNAKSIGIECLHAKGEDWPPIQKEALAWLLRKLMADYRIPLTSIDTHGQIAVPGPYIRKQDPTDWPRPDFLRWRDALEGTQVVKRYRLARIPVYQRSDHTGTVAAYLHEGDVVEIDDPKNGHMATGLGFIDPNILEALS